MACASSTPGSPIASYSGSYPASFSSSDSQIASCSSSSPASPTPTLDPCLVSLPGSHTNSNGHTYMADRYLDDMEFCLLSSGTSSPSESVATLPESLRHKLRSSSYADGFLEDISMLMKSFSDLKSVEFKDFRNVWNDMEFYRIYECRPNPNELYIFTNDIYVITSQFLLVDCYYMNIGAVYALYSLYIVQDEGSRIPIRIEIEHYEVIKDLRRKAIENKYLTLHYVIDYLLENNSFVYVKSQYKFGPLCTFSDAQKKQANAKLDYYMRTFKDSFIDYRLHSVLPLFKDAMKEYNDAKMEAGEDELPPSQTQVRKVEELMMKIESVLNPGVYLNSNIQTRRAKLRAKAYQYIATQRPPIGALSLGLMSTDETKKFDEYKIRKWKKVFQFEKEVGRGKEMESLPNKHKSEDEIAISRLIEEQERLYSPVVTTTKKVRTRRATYYVDDSPEKKKRKPKKLAQPPNNQQQNNDHDKQHRRKKLAQPPNNQQQNNDHDKQRKRKKLAQPPSKQQQQQQKKDHDKQRRRKKLAQPSRNQQQQQQQQQNDHDEPEKIALE